MSDEEPFFVARDKAVWACWLSGRAAVRLGTEAEVRAAMRQFVAGASGSVPAEPAPPAPAPPPPPPPDPRREPTQPPVPATPAVKREENERGETRHDITVIGRVFTGTGAREVTVLDLSERGCRFHDRSGRLTDGVPLTIKLGPIGPVEATVRWREGEYVGVRFDNALYPSVMEHIRQHFNLRR